MKSALNGYAVTLGYAIVVARSKKTRRGLRQVYYKCDRGKTYRIVMISATISSMLV